jgi:hypothetical protein
MPVFSLRDLVGEDLKILNKLTAPLCTELCQVGLTFLSQGAKKGTFKKAASALSVEEDAVAGAVMGLCEVMLEAAKLNLSQAEFIGSIGDVSMPEENRRAVSTFYEENKSILKDRIASSGNALSKAGGTSGASQSFPEYRSLDWRFEINVASRQNHDSYQPLYTLRLDTATPAATGASGADAEGAGGALSTIFTSDYTTLKSVSEALDEAVAEMKTAHSKRVMRYIR